MGAKALQRQKMIDAIVANSSVWDEGDADVLNSFSDEKLTTLYEHEGQVQQAFAIANAAVSGFADDSSGTAYRMNAETGQWERSGAANCNDGMRKPAGGGGGEYPEEEEEEEPGMNRRRDNVRRSSTTTNRRSRTNMTTEEWLRNAPQAVQDAYRYSMEVVNREKEKIINEILTNSRVPETDRAVHAERLSRRSIEELKDDLSLLPKVPVDNEDSSTRNRRRPSRNGGHRDEDMLDLPRISFGKDEVGKDGGQQSSTHNSLDEGDYLDEDEWLRNAPPQIRQKVMNASRLESQEREKLIEQLTENVEDDEDAHRLRNRLSTKSVEELKDMLVLSNRSRDDRRGDYRGASGGVVNQLRQAAGDPDDVLPVPRIDWTENAKIK